MFLDILQKTNLVSILASVAKAAAASGLRSSLCMINNYKGNCQLEHLADGKADLKAC